MLAAKICVNSSGPIMPETPRRLASAPCSRPCSEAPLKRVARPWNAGLAIAHNAISGGADKNSQSFDAKA